VLGVDADPLSSPPDGLGGQAACGSLPRFVSMRRRAQRQGCAGAGLRPPL